MAHRSVAMNAGMTPSLSSITWRLSGNRSKSVAAGANGISSGNSDRSLTKSATFGRQNAAVAYQIQSVVVGFSSAGARGPFSLVRSFFVAWIVYMVLQLCTIG